MKMLMENWNQFINEGDEDETIDLKLKQLEQELKNSGLPDDVADDVVDAVEDEKKGSYVMGLHATETLEEAKMPSIETILNTAGVATFASAFMKGYQIVQEMGVNADGVAEALQQAMLPSLGAAAALTTASFILTVLSHKEKDPYKDPMREQKEEDEEMSLEDLIRNLKVEDVVSAVNNWAKGGKHTMDDLHMHLGKMMSEGIEKTKGGKYYATSKSGRRLSKKSKTKDAALDQLAAVEASKAERKK